MNKQSVAAFLKGLKVGVEKHSPEILTAIGITGMITTTVLAVKATPKALKHIEQKKVDADKNELTKVEIVQAAWKPYIPAVVTGVVSTACLVGANSVHSKRNAALAAAYQLSTTALSEYKEKVIETIGEKKEKAVHDNIAKDKVKKMEESQPISSRDVIFTGKGESLCLDIMSGRLFKSDRDRIVRAMNNLNYRMNGGMEMYISLNEFYDEIGLPRIPIGDTMGWSVGKGQIDIHFSAQLTEEDEPCMVIEHLIPPEYGFNKLY